MPKRPIAKKSAGRPTKLGGHASQQIVLRVPEDIFELLNLAVQRRLVKIPRHTWLLEAVMEKLTRELPAKGDEHGSK